jgi:coenzyme F420 hydrogenase subunit beta
MVETAPGFPRPDPIAPLSPDEDRAIAEICPGLGQEVVRGDRERSVLWGPYRSVATGWATDPDLRHAGASGGALSAILVHLLQSETVDAVLQIAADPDRPTANRTVVSTDRDGVLAAAGSRYAPSAPLADIAGRVREHRATGRRFAFVSKPCDTAALAAMRARDPLAHAAFPVLVSFFCAGVPSLDGTMDLLSAMVADTAAVRRFRYRGMGWPGRATAVLSDGTERSMSYAESWGGVLSRHVQHRCKICADGTGKAADIVCADAWACDANGYPIFEERPGVSLILARTDLGERIVTEARAEGGIETAPFDIADLDAIQPGQRERRRAVLARLLALRLLGRPVPAYAGLDLWASARQNTLRRNLRNFAGMLARVLRGRPGRSQ